jgi:LPXTG-motif cell wall-anchored protein
MKRLNLVAMLCCFVFVGLAFTPQAKAQTRNQKTVMTFSDPFEVPGVDAQILPAGTYVFRLVDSDSDRNIVQITNEEGTHVFTTILAINNYRLKRTDKTVLTFNERGEGQPQAIKAWFYPGYAYGQEFVYPKKRAMELAKVVNEPVLDMPIETTETTPVETLKSVPVAAIKPTGEEVAVAEVVETPPAAVATKAEPVAVVAKAEPATLPHTASSTPLFALAGLLSLCVGFGLLIVMKRTA